jgi:hypothetical protein
MKTRIIPFLAFLAACGGHAAGDAAQGLAPDPVCDRYLACTDATNPDGFEDALSAYGDRSPCWQSTDQAAQACSAACAVAEAELGTCGCSSAAACKDARGTQSFSDTTDHACHVTIGGVPTCVAYADLSPVQVGETNKSCVSQGGTPSAACPASHALGVCTLPDGASTVTYYAAPALTAALAEQACVAAGGTWAGS